MRVRARAHDGDDAMPRIPIHYDSYYLSNGLRGSARKIVGRGVHHTLIRDAADAEISSYHHHIGVLTAMDPGDVESFCAICIEERALFVVRCAGEGTRRFANLGIGVSGKPEEDKEGVKVGNDLVQRGNGQLIVSDYDLMSVWRADSVRYHKLEFTRDGPGDQASWTNPDAERLFMRLNAVLHVKLEHGANDDWNPTNPKHKQIRDGAVIGNRRYVAFTDRGDYRLLNSPAELKTYYTTVLKAIWPYPT
jgi:hypothetical protein